MDLDKKYKAPEGYECNILQLVKIEPEWAANIIQYYETKIAALQSHNSAMGAIDLRDKLSSAILRGIVRGKSPNEIADIIIEMLNQLHQ